jgi:lambda repressor-like predicted transcriptional regulator
MAKYFIKSKANKRSVLLYSFCGEEKGLFQTSLQENKPTVYQFYKEIISPILQVLTNPIWQKRSINIQEKNSIGFFTQKK